MKKIKLGLLFVMMSLGFFFIGANVSANYSSFFADDFDVHNFSFTYKDQEYSFPVDSLSSFGPNEFLKVENSVSAKKMASVVGVFWGEYQKAHNIDMIVYQNLDTNNNFLSARHNFGCTQYQNEWVSGFSLGYYKGYDWLAEYLIDYDLKLMSVDIDVQKDKILFDIYVNKNSITAISSVTLNGNVYALTKDESASVGSSQSYTLSLSSILANETVTDATVCVDFMINQFTGTKDEASGTALTCNVDNFTYFRKKVSLVIKIEAECFEKNVALEYKKSGFHLFNQYTTVNQRMTYLGFNLENNGVKIKNAYQIGIELETSDRYIINDQGKQTTQLINGNKYPAIFYQIKDLGEDLEGFKKLVNDNTKGLTKEALSKQFLLSNQNGEYLAYPGKDSGLSLVDESLQKIHNNDNRFIINNRAVDSYCDYLSKELGKQINHYDLLYNTAFGRLLEQNNDLDVDNDKVASFWNKYDYSFAVDSDIVNNVDSNGVTQSRIKVIDCWSYTEEGQAIYGTSCANGFFVTEDKKVVNQYGEIQNGYSVNEDNLIIDSEGNVVDYNSKTTTYKLTEVEKDTNDILSAFNNLFNNIGKGIGNIGNFFSNIGNSFGNLGSVVKGVLIVVITVLVVYFGFKVILGLKLFFERR